MNTQDLDDIFLSVSLLHQTELEAELLNRWQRFRPGSFTALLNPLAAFRDFDFDIHRYQTTPYEEPSIKFKNYDPMLCSPQKEFEQSVQYLWGNPKHNTRLFIGIDRGSFDIPITPEDAYPDETYIVAGLPNRYASPVLRVLRYLQSVKLQFVVGSNPSRPIGIIDHL